MVAEKTERKPRRIGPQAVGAAEAEAVTDEAEGEEITQSTFQAFQDSLSTDELLDWDDAAGGIIGAGEIRVTMRVLMAMAWIVTRRTEPRLTWRQVRARPLDQNMAMIKAALEEIDAPKADTAPAT